MSSNLPVLLNSQQGGSNLASYLASVNAQPILTEQQEREFAIRYNETEDLDAARELILSHLRFVVKVARGFVGYGLPLEDLIQEGNVGLMKAVKRYEPDRNVRLVSFAVHWIKAEIYNFILHNWKIVRITTTKAHRKLFFNLRKFRTSLESMSEKEIKTLSDELDVPVEVIREMEIRMNGTAISFDASGDEDADEASLAPASYLGDRRFNPEDIYEKNWEQDARNEQFENALDCLDERSKSIIKRRWLGDKKISLQDLAKEYKVSAERIRQIEEKAIRMMRQTIVKAQPELVTQ